MELTALMIVISNDIHYLHFIIYGCSFDRLHADVLKDYYEKLAEDFDELTELFMMFDNAVALNPNNAAAFIGWQSVDIQKADKEYALNALNERLELLCDKMNVLYKACDEIKDCPKTVAITSWLHSKLEYWVKELNYFTKRRMMS